jgi:homoserine kinase
MDPHPDVHPVVLIPPTELPTTKARALLPAEVPFSDASHNVSRSALLVHAMTTDPRRLMSATSDRLHQQCRSSAYPDSVALVARLREAGVPAVISGAGPTVLAFAEGPTLTSVGSAAGPGWRVLPVAVSLTGAREVPVPPLP